MHPTVYKPMRIIILACLALALGFPAMAAEFPTKSITLVIPYPAGGSTDLTGRA